MRQVYTHRLVDWVLVPLGAGIFAAFVVGVWFILKTAFVFP